MSEIKKKGIGKAKAGLAVSAILIVILAVSNVWLYANSNNQIATLNTEYHDYALTHSHTNSEYDDLNSTYSNFAANHHHTDTEYNSLQSQSIQLQTWLNGNLTQIANLQAQVQLLTNQKNQLQTWLDGNVSSKNQQIVDLQNEIASKNQQIVDLSNQIASKNQQIGDLQNEIASKNQQITNLQNQVANLQNQIDTLRAPKLIKIKVDEDTHDDRPLIGAPYLHVQGIVCNVGTNTAYKCRLHVVAYQSGGAVAIDTYISLGTISGESWRTVDTVVYYGGSALTSWSITCMHAAPANEYFSFSDVVALAEPQDPHNNSILVSQVGFKITAVGGNATNVLVRALQGGVPLEDTICIDEIISGTSVQVGPIEYHFDVLAEWEEGKGWGPLLFQIVCNETEGEVTVYVTEFFILI